MPDPTPIRGRWTVWVSSDGQQVSDDDTQWAESVEVVPVPDEQAIERAEDAVERILRRYSSVLSQEILAEQIVAAVLVAALEQPE